MKRLIRLASILVVQATCVFGQQEQLYRQIKWPTFSRSDPITNSFVFLNGEYLEAPYFVSCSNLAILINGRIVVDYSDKLAAPPSVPKDPPSMPTTFTKETLWHDPAVGRYLSESMRFFSATGGIIDDKAENMKKVYMRLPFVKDVKWEGGTDLKVTTIDGETHVCSIAFPSRQLENTPERIGMRIDKECVHLVRALMEDGSMFHFTHFGKRISLGKGQAKTKLIELWNIAHAAELTDKEKAVILGEKMGLKLDSSDEYSSFIRKLVASEQFEGRVKKLVEENAKRPKEIDVQHQQRRSGN